MKKLEISWIVFSFELLTGCMSVRYVVDRQDVGRHEAYQTYSIEEHCLDITIGVNPINQQRIQNAIEVNLRKYGLQPDKNASDLLVKYFIKNKTIYYNSGCDDYYDTVNGGRQCVERISSYEEGSLIVDVIDQMAQKVIWHGAAVGPTYDKMKDPQKKIDKIVGELLEDFEAFLKSAESYSSIVY
jgi:hypothetical protein